MGEQPLNKRALTAYSLPSAPLSMLNMMLIVYMPPFYAAAIGLDLAAVGGVFFLARLWDAFIDPVVGNLSDKTNSKWGRRKPWIALGVPVMLFVFYFFSFPPENTSSTYLLVVAFFFYVASTIVQIPYLSWGAELSRDYHERTRITGYREAATMIGIILATCIPLFFLRGTNASVEDIVRVFSISIFVLLPVCTIGALLFAPKAPSIGGKQGLSLLKTIGLLWPNKPFLRLLTIMFLIWLGGGIYNATGLFLTQGLGFTPIQFLWLLLVQYAVGLAVMPFHVWVGGKLGKHKALLFVGMSFFIVLPMLLLVQPGVFWQIMLVYILKGAVTAAIWVMPPALVADSIEYGMLKGAGDDAAIYMSLYFFIQKAAMALGVGIALPMAAMLGYDPRLGAEAALGGLKFTSVILPAIVALPAAYLLYFYPITERRHAAIRARLRAKGIAAA